MSFLKGTNVELIAACSVAGTALANSANAGVLNSASGAAWLPQNFWPGALYKTIKVEARGIYSTASSGNPTLQVGATLNATEGTGGIGSLTFLTGAVTPVASATNWYWELQVELMTQALTETSGAGTANITGLGWLELHQIALGGAYTVGTTAKADRIPVGSASVVDQSMSAGCFVEIYGKWSSGVASTSIQCLHSAVYGCN